MWQPSRNLSNEFVFRATSDVYTVKEVDCDIGGRAFKVCGKNVVYHVRVNPDECECMGFLKYGTCRHLKGVLEALYE
jgi:hypothetical protein